MTGRTDDVLAAMGLGVSTAVDTGGSATARPAAHRPEPEWPTLDPAALYGPIGDAVRIIEPETEADPAAVLVSLLAGIGAMIGAGPHIIAGHMPHPPRVAAVVVGETSKGGKGTSLAAASLVLRGLDPDFMRERTLGGFGSGEALVDAVADPDPDGNNGATDKRLLLVEPEWSRVLRTAARDGSTLSAIIREAWDGGRLQARSRTRTAVATGHHVCIIGHVVADELRRYLTATDVAGGSANRLLYVCARRTKLLPHGGADLATALTPTVDELRSRIAGTRRVGTVDFTAAARDHWTAIYGAIENDDPGGMLGAVTGRGSPHTLRVALLYALLDGRDAIDVAHLDAAYALWRYARDSAAYIFGDALGDDVADRILAAVRAAPAGLTYTELDRAIGKHTPRARRDHALATLARRGLVTTETVETGGRPSTVVRAT